MPVAFLDSVPLGFLFLGTLVLVLAAFEVGHRVGKWRRQGKETEGAPHGTVVGALLALLAFMLAVTFGNAASRFDTRKQLLLQEVNSIETTYLRADFLPEALRDAVREDLRRYVELRTHAGRENVDISDLIRRSEALQGKLWKAAADASALELRNPDIVALFIDSLNQTLDLHQERVTVSLYRIPSLLWWVFGLLTFLSMSAVGYQFGTAGSSSRLLSTLLALCFAAVVTLIADLDRTTGGYLKVNQQPMTKLLERLGPPRG